MALRWQDVDWQASRLEVHHTLTRDTAGWRLDEPKTARGRRSVRLANSAVVVLRSHWRRQLEQRLLVADAWEDNDFVFCNPIGRPLDGRHVTAATLLMSQGVHPKGVQEMLGHSTIALTLDVYSHVVPAMQDDAAAKMESVLAAV